VRNLGWRSRHLVNVLVAAGLLLSATLLKAEAQREKEEQPKGKVPRYTDDDLARYRERREGASPLEAESPPPADPGRDTPTGAEGKPRVEKARGRVVLDDRRGRLPPELRRKAESMAQRMVALYGDPVGADESLVIPLRYFDTEEDYVDFSSRIAWVNPRWHGFYNPVTGEIVVGDRGAPYPILVHEVSHYVVSRLFREAPRWFDEGLAEYFEQASISGDAIRSSPSPSHQAGLADWLKTGKRPDLRELLGMNTWTWIDHDWEKGYMVRALAWSIVDVMMSSEGHETLRDFIEALKARGGLHSYEALERSYRGGAHTFEEAWVDRVGQVAEAQSAP
jgi:hypothetical protein